MPDGHGGRHGTREVRIFVKAPEINKLEKAPRTNPKAERAAAAVPLERGEAEPLDIVELKVEPGNISFIADPHDPQKEHVETYLSFFEAVKLKRGNANVRTANDSKKPFKAMVNSAEATPADFHVLNRGVVYVCPEAQYDAAARTLTITTPPLKSRRMAQEPFGVLDGGHTLGAVHQIVEETDMVEFTSRHKGVVPYVRVHFIVNRGDRLNVRAAAEALNTSSQVMAFTLHEYQNAFQGIKDVLHHHKFNPHLVAFRENEDREWHVVEIIQRVACFLPRWKSISPMAMYKSKAKALELYANPTTRKEFAALENVFTDVLTLPEYIVSQFSTGGVLKGRKLGKLSCVRKLKEPYMRPPTTYFTEHKIDIGAILPMAAAFREALYFKRGEDVLSWKIPYQEVFKECADQLYGVLAAKMSNARGTAQVASDPDYWSQCALIVSRAKDSFFRD